MKKVMWCLMAALAVSGSAMAQMGGPGGGPGGPGGGPGGQYQGPGGGPGGPQGGRGPQGWGHAGPGHHHRYLGPGGRGFDYGPGDRMPPQYMGEHYWIGDYGHYGLPPPPPGDRWMYDPDGNYVLVSMATSMVVEALLHSRW